MISNPRGKRRRHSSGRHGALERRRVAARFASPASVVGPPRPASAAARQRGDEAILERDASRCAGVGRRPLAFADGLVAALLEEQVAVLGDELADRAGPRRRTARSRRRRARRRRATGAARRSRRVASATSHAAQRSSPLSAASSAHAHGGVEEPEDLAGGLRAHGHGLDVAQRELVQRLAQRRGLIDRDDAARLRRRGSRPALAVALTSSTFASVSGSNADATNTGWDAIARGRANERARGCGRSHVTV